MAIVGGVLFTSITLLVVVPQYRMFPAPTVIESRIAKPMIVEELAVQAAKVSAALFVLEPDAAALMSEALMIRRA